MAQHYICVVCNPDAETTYPQDEIVWRSCPGHTRQAGEEAGVHGSTDVSLGQADNVGRKAVRQLATEEDETMITFRLRILPGSRTEEEGGGLTVLYPKVVLIADNGACRMRHELPLEMALGLSELLARAAVYAEGGREFDRTLQWSG